MAGLQAAHNLLRHFAPGLIELKNAPVNLRAVDLAREERLQRADDVVHKFEKITQCSGYMKALKGERSTELLEKAKLVQNQLVNLLKKTKGDSEGLNNDHQPEDVEME